MRTSPRILIVDDCADSRFLIGRHLTRAGFTTYEAQNGQEAVAMANAELYDAILMDMQMPVMDGYTATASLREKGFTMPIYAVSGCGSREEIEHITACGCTDHLRKPLDFPNLLRMLQKIPQQNVPTLTDSTGLAATIESRS